MKKLLTGFCMAFGLMIFSLPVFCYASDYTSVVDNADIFTDSEEEILREKVSSLIDECECDILIYTTDESYSETTEDFVEEFYFANGHGYNGTDDGIVLYIDMYYRYLSIQTFGQYNNYTDKQRDILFEDVYDKLINDDYYGGALVFIDEVPDYISGSLYDDSNGNEKRSLESTEILICIGVPVILFVIIFVSVKVKYGSEGKEKPYPFREKANVNLYVSRDDFVREFTTHVTHTSSNSGVGGGHSRSFRSSSGRSSSSRGHFLV